MFIKQFGAPRSGTNYVRFLIESNYNVRILVNQRGWKHGYAQQSLHKNIKCIIVAKNIFSWLSSAFDYYKNQHRNERILPKDCDDIFTFISSEFILTRHGQILSYKNAIHYWNHIYRHWLSLPTINHPIFIVRHEDLLADAEATLDKLAKTFRIKRKTNTFINTSQSFKPTGNAGVIQREKKFRHNYYANSEYMDRFDDEARDLVIKELDKTVYANLGYTKLLLL